MAQAAAAGGVVSLLCYGEEITARVEKQSFGVGEGKRAPADSPASSLLFLSLIDPPRSCAHFSLISHLLFQQRSRRAYISSLLRRSPSTTPPPHLSYGSFLDNQAPPTDPHHLYRLLIRPRTLRALLLRTGLQLSAIYRKKVT